MVTAQRGKPFCRAAGRFLKEEHDQCWACIFIVYVGCPEFQAKTGLHKRAREYLQWFYDEKDILVASGEIEVQSSGEKTK